MATSNVQGRKQVVSVILAEPESNLRSLIFTSREELVTIEKIDDAYPQQAVKVTIDVDAITPGDFVARSVLAGNRRKLEILATDDQGVGFRHILAQVSVDRKFVSQKLIEFVDGNTVIELPQAVLMAAYKGR